MAGNSTEVGRSVTSKVIAILATFAKGGVFSLTELAQANGLPVSTTHRLTGELIAWGVLERTHDGRFRIGTRLRAFAGVAAPPPSIIQRVAHSVLEDLAVASRCGRIRLGVVDGFNLVHVERKVADRAGSTTGGRAPLPMHATALGKVLLAFAHQDLFDRVVSDGLTRYTPFTIISPDRLRRTLSATRLTRLAVARRELDPRHSAVAVPVFGTGGAVVAALEVTVREPYDLRLLHPPLIVAGRSLSRTLQSRLPGDWRAAAAGGWLSSMAG